MAGLSRHIGPLLSGAAALFFLFGASSTSRADELFVALIIDDIGDHLHDGRRAVSLPAAVTMSVLPGTPFADRLAREAYASGKEVMLHLPMDAMSAKPLGPGGLTEAMGEGEFLATLRADLAAVPHVSGINNHMGSRMTTDPVRMAWLMSEIHSRAHLFFVDSRTTAATVAESTAGEYGIPNSRRDVFIDNENDPAAIEGQLDKLLALARRTGGAIGIGHARPTTLSVLERRLPQLAAEGIRLVPVSRVIAIQTEKRPKLWHASLSRSHPAVKSSKQ